MNTAALKYRLYKQLLEGNINRRQHDMLLELGFLDKVKSFFGAGAEVGGDLAKLFKDKASQKQLAVAKDNIGKAIKDLKDIASKAGMGDDVVNQFLQSALSGGGVEPGAVASAKPTNDGGKGGAEAAGGVKPGTTIKAGEPSAAPAIARAAGEAAGQKPEEAAAQAEEKKVTPEKATEVLGKSIAKSAGVDAKAAVTVVKALLDTGHLVAEGRYRPSVGDFKRAIAELNEASRPGLVFERWQHLAGVTVINEGKTDDLIKNVEGKKVTKADDLQKQMDAIMKGPDKGKFLQKNIAKLKAAFEKAAPEEAKKVKWDAVGSAAAGDKAADAKAEEAKKKYAGAFDAVKKGGAKDVEDAVVGKILAALDDLDSLKIS